jgi:hypothetical protein
MLIKCLYAIKCKTSVNLNVLEAPCIWSCATPTGACQVPRDGKRQQQIRIAKSRGKCLLFGAEEFIPSIFSASLSICRPELFFRLPAWGAIHQFMPEVNPEIMPAALSIKIMPAFLLELHCVLA